MEPHEDGAISLHIDELDVAAIRLDGGANHVETVAGYTGAGVRAEVMDEGLLVSHPAFQSIPPIVRDNLEQLVRRQRRTRRTTRSSILTWTSKK